MSRILTGLDCLYEYLREPQRRLKESPRPFFTLRGYRSSNTFKVSTCKVSKFADDTKIASKVISTLDKEFLQRDLDKLSNWARDGQMKFNVEKCKVMHIGINNDNAKYLMNGVELSVTNTETDLGVMISDDMKPCNQCSKVVKTANKLVGFIGRTFKHESEKVILTFYN